jgi:hypothetical protein
VDEEDFRALMLQALTTSPLNAALYRSGEEGGKSVAVAPLAPAPQQQPA